MATNSTLQNPLPVYHRFVDNQVLTDNQLNEVLDHLNYQDKLTRSSLIGIGIVCGLEIDFGGNFVKISRGVAVTSDGDLMKLGDSLYKGFKSFKDESVRYDRFMQGDQSMQLFQLIENSSASDVTNLSQFESKTGIEFDKAVAILYLEDFLKEEEDCSPVDCDSQGREVVNQLRVLVCSLADAEKIAQRDSIFRALLMEGKSSVIHSLNPVRPSRVNLNPGIGSSLEKFKNSYDSGFRELMDLLLPISRLSLFSSQRSSFELDLKLFFEKLESDVYNFQYLRDFHLDLASACNDLLALLKENYAICCPDILAFPKHVFLGEVSNSPPVFRHGFYASPSHGHHKIEFIQKRFSRILEMITHFDPSPTRDIRITPSRSDYFSLGERAVPFYYDLQKSDNPLQFLDSWNSKELSPNYHRIGFENGPDPIDIELAAHDFYRIEGHVGNDVLDAMKTLDKVRKERGLAFDVAAIAIGGDGDEDVIDYDRYAVFFEDLQVILEAWNEEQRCIAASSTKFLTGFSVEEKGKHNDFPKKFATTENRSAGEIERLRERELEIIKIRGEERKERSKVGRKSAKTTNPVIKNVDKSTGGMGLIYEKAVKAESNASDYQVEIKKNLEAVVVDWDEEFVKAIVDLPSQLLGHLKISEDYKLSNVQDFSNTRLERYLEALLLQSEVAKEVKKELQSLVDQSDSKLADQAYIENYFFTINRIISSSCMVEKIRVLYETIIERREELLSKFVLKRFVDSHPGLEHKAGVPKGGTFVLVYYGSSKSKTTTDNIEAKTKSLAVAENPSNNFLNFRGLGAPVRTTGGATRFTIGRNTVRDFGFASRELRSRDLEFAEELSSFELKPRADTSVRNPDNAAPGMVVGDLFLPYIISSDIPANSFVYPDQKVSLFIGKEYICRPTEGEADLVPIEVSPAGGEVLAYIGKTKLEERIIKTRGESRFFDPNIISKNQVNKDIRFTVDGQDVESTVQVVFQPRVEFKRTGSTTYTNGNTRASISFTNSSPQFDGQEFIWDFGDGTILKSNAQVLPHIYVVEPGKEYVFNVKLKAVNRSCEDSAEVGLSFTVPIKEDEDNRPNEAIDLIKNGGDSLRRFRDSFKRELGTELVNFYNSQFEPVYEIIFDDLEASLKGSLDEKIIQRLQKIQSNITINRVTSQNDRQKEFWLRLYNENALLYLYVQHAREDTKKSIGNLTGKWGEFMSTAVNKFEGPSKMMVIQSPVLENWQMIAEANEDRMTRPLLTSVNKVIASLRRFA